MAVAIVGAVVAVVGAISDFMGAKGQARIQNAQNYATRITNDANNEYRVAAAALQNFVRSQQNSRIMKAAGENYNTLGQNIVRTMDEAVRGTVAKRLQAAEVIGSMATAAAAVGVGGSTTEMLNSTFRRAVSFSESSDREKVRYVTGDMSQQRQNQISNAVAAMDQGTTFAQTQSHISFDQKVNPWGYALQGIQNALPYVSAFMDNRAAASAASTASSSSGSTAGISKSGANLK